MNYLKLKTKNLNKGFTFIEILVVLTIIAVLTAVGVTNYRVANQKARDGKRKADLEQIRAALELYRTDQATYPATLDFGGSLSAGGSTYMEVIPDDSTSGYNYSYSSDTNTYSLCAYLERTEASDPSCPAGSLNCGLANCNYGIKSPL
jgi:general secretion pathway protein G